METHFFVHSSSNDILVGNDDQVTISARSKISLIILCVGDTSMLDSQQLLPEGFQCLAQKVYKPPFHSDEIDLWTGENWQRTSTKCPERN